MLSSVRRYMYTHAVMNPEYKPSVYSVFSQINSPIVYNSTYAQLKNGITTVLGNPDKWVDYLGTCAPCCKRVPGPVAAIACILRLAIWHISPSAWHGRHDHAEFSSTQHISFCMR